jgi:hypothetical protein
MNKFENRLNRKLWGVVASGNFEIFKYLTNNGISELTPAELAKLPHGEFRQLVNKADPLWGRNDVGDRYMVKCEIIEENSTINRVTGYLEVEAATVDSAETVASEMLETMTYHNHELKGAKDSYTDYEDDVDAYVIEVEPLAANDDERMVQTPTCKDPRQIDFMDQSTLIA